MRRPLIIALAVIALMLGACHPKKKQNPILDEKELRAFLVDVYIAEAKLGQIRVNRDSAMKLFTPYERSLMKKRKIDSVVLKNTYRHYLENPADFEKVFELVMDTLSLRQQKAQAALKNSAKAIENPKPRPATKSTGPLPVKPKAKNIIKTKK